MTGSGSAVFGIFDDEDSAQEAYSVLRKKYSYAFIEKPVARGTAIEE